MDALLLDSGNPRLPVKVLGGTGRTHDWSVSRQVVQALAPLPVYLAGGLTPENVAEGIAAVQPYAVDVASGTEASPGVKDPAKLQAFFRAVAAADERMATAA